MKYSVSTIMAKGALSLVALAAVTFTSNAAQAACETTVLPGGGTRTVCSNVNNSTNTVNSGGAVPAPAPAPAADTTGIVTQIYQMVLSRTPDAGGLAYWNDQMRKGMPASEVRRHIAHSQESQNNVNNAYTSILGRVPDEAGFQFWIQGLSTTASLESVRQQFANSPEGTAAINSLYVQHLGRDADAGGMAYFKGIAAVHGLNAVRHAIMNSAEYASKH